MADEVDYKKFQILMEMVYQQQNFYWQRFSAFATLHAALFVLVTAMMIGTQFWQFRPSVLVSILSTGLAIVWIAVQLLSRKYANEWKEAFHQERKRVGFESSIKLNPDYSSTDWALLVPIGVLFLWFIVLGTIFWRMN